MQAAAALAAFNLVCQTQFAGPTTNPRPTIIYRVDPILGRYCWDACVSTQPIAALSTGEIVFASEGGDFAGPYRTVIRIGLLSGAYRHSDVRFDQPQLIMNGHCERAPFSGFPPESLRFAVPLRVAVPASID